MTALEETKPATIGKFYIILAKKKEIAFVRPQFKWLDLKSSQSPSQQTAVKTGAHQCKILTQAQSWNTKWTSNNEWTNEKQWG